MGMALLEGNEAVAWGAVAAGCNFFAGYPITPATSILSTMQRILPPLGGIAVQGEDEIASIGYCLGASMAGCKAMTATSGPGLSLYSENISFAIGSEIPLVIVNVQRLGPSTGSATRGSDGDIQFVRWGNSGGMPIICLAPVDIEDCFVLTAKAFNLAEEFRIPVFIASNKEIGMTRDTVDLEALAIPQPAFRFGPERDSNFMPFRPLPDKHVPGFAPIGEQLISRQTSSTHGENGYITNIPEEIGTVIERLERKIRVAADRLAVYDFDREPGARSLLITYGVTSRAATVAVRQLRAAGEKISHLTLKTLWPVPETIISAAATASERVFVIEMNMGQYVREVRRVIRDKPVFFLGQENGRLISPAQVVELFRKEAVHV
jgi:2-oxoglutarate ferredoxin oxidoreductase subunit alpha